MKRKKDHWERKMITVLRIENLKQTREDLPQAIRNARYARNTTPEGVGLILQQFVSIAISLGIPRKTVGRKESLATIARMLGISVMNVQTKLEQGILVVVEQRKEMHECSCQVVAKQLMIENQSKQEYAK